MIYISVLREITKKSLKEEIIAESALRKAI